MRKRGFILLTTTMPLWVFSAAQWLLFPLHHIGSWSLATDARPRSFTLDTFCVAVTSTALAVGLLLFDFVKWIRARS
jgi:hypothetical protein